MREFLVILLVIIFVSYGFGDLEPRLIFGSRNGSLEGAFCNFSSSDVANFLQSLSSVVVFGVSEILSSEYFIDDILKNGESSSISDEPPTFQPV